MKTKWVSLFVLLLLLGGPLAFSQTVTDKFWVIFTDKGDLSQWKPQDFLAQRSIDRRERQGISLKFNDYPISKDYVQGVAQVGAGILYPSKWLNAVSVRMDDATAAQVAELPYVQEVKRIPKVILEMDPVLLTNVRAGYSPGFSSEQINMLGLNQLHKNGYNGHGILISMMDNGFRNADKNPYLAHLFETNRVVATWDFVHHDANVYDQGDHGAFTLSILGAWRENTIDTAFWFLGSAHGASFILCHTEDDAAETHQEEDNWAAAMEYADSIGADVFSTSLGYKGFDNGDDYGYAGMDGNTTIITRAADIAASKGIVVLNSAGNEGNGDINIYGKRKMLAPSDGDSVISVGAVGASRVVARFSSQGPSFDGRIKPDISAMGENDSYVSTEGILKKGNGTSFSCPVAAGMAACLLQSAPETKNMDLYQAIIRSADRYAQPDTFYGYGIPYAPEAYRILTGKTLSSGATYGQMNEDSIQVYPNPAMDHFDVAIDNGATAWQGILDIVDKSGRVLWSRSVEVAPFYNVYHLTRATDYPRMSSGRYQVRLRPVQKEGTAKATYTAPMIILTQR